MNQGEYVRNLLDSYEVENALYFNGNAYFIINQEMTYTEAQEYCEKLGGKILRNPREEEREFLSGNFAEGTTGENYFNLGNKEYRYYLKTEQKYRSGWLTNVVCSMDIHSEMPLFAIRFGTGKKDQNVPVTYYRYFAYGEDISKYQKYTVIEETNICMERYTWELSVSINPDGTSNVILRDKLYDIRNWEKETGNLFVITELSDPASINQYSGGAYTTYNTDIPIFDSFEDAFLYFKTGNSKLPVNQQQCQNFGRDGKKFFVCKVSNKESKETTECKIMLSTGEIITLNEDPDKGNMTTDTDGDGIADLLELVEKIPVTIPGTYESVAVWTYRSNPVKTDSDGDNITDREDPAPMSYNIMIENVYGNVVKLNTDAVWSIFGIDINKFYEHYYIRYDLFENREELESYKRILELNEQRYYTPEELAFLTAIDLNGVKDYLHYQPKGYMGCVYRALPGNEDIPAEEIQQIAEEYFYVKSASQVAEEYLNKTITQVICGKFATERTGLGSIGEIGVAFTGADFIADLRDLAYDIENWKISWEHLGETALDALGLLPVIGVIKNVVKVSKAGDVFAIVKIGDKVFEFRRLGSISDILTESGSKYIRNELAFAGSPGYAMDIMGSELYGDILKSCENMDEYKYLYNNPVLEAFQKNADDVKYLKEKNPGKLDDIIEDACNSGIKNADDLENFTAEALEAANKGGSTSKYLKQLDNLSENKINHIINGSKNSNHGWEKLVPDKNWSDIKNIIANVMDTGVEGPYKSVFSKKATINGFEVEVTYTKLSDGTIKISDAWVN